MDQSASDLSSLSATIMQPAAMGLTSYILTTFFPDAVAHFARHPRLTRMLSFVFATWVFGPYAYAQIVQLWNRMRSYATTTISVQSSDELFDPLLRWLSVRKTFHWETRFRLHSHLRQSGVVQIARKKGPINKIGSWFNKLGIEYDPQGGHHCFFYKRRLFIMDKDFGSYEHDGHIILTCLGRSKKPLDDILDEVMTMYKESKDRYTTVRRPHGGHNWGNATDKPQRAMESVNIDPEQKERLLADLDNYVAGKSASWYAARCIPYRRGYLFYGPPGTGKSSLALAIAARYQSDIYMLSLLDRHIYDESLLNLFNSLPPRALILLEDIDSAGLKRELLQNTPITRPATQVTLSGLLNAIDGVDSPEGHILIMTSNAPEELDEALVRSGRVSVKVGFRKSTAAQGKEIFLRMYQDDVHDPGLNLTTERLEELGSQFAKKLPDYEFSPADLQDYLLMRKSEPQRAVDELEGFVGQILTERAEEAEGKKEKVKKDKTTADESYYSHSDGISDSDL